jgi:hypothetical protein
MTAIAGKPAPTDGWVYLKDPAERVNIAAFARLTD